MEFEKSLATWKYVDQGYREDGIVLQAEFRIPTIEKWSDPIELLLDTGYDGEILLSYEQFILAGYNKFSFSSVDNKAQSITGEIFNLTRINTIIRINNEEFDVIIETHPKINDNIVGRALLNRFNAVMMGKKKEWSIYLI